MSVAGAADATERELDLSASGAMIDVHQPAEDVAHRSECLVNILCKDRSG
jgi:hypothetical protein